MAYLQIVHSRSLQGSGKSAKDEAAANMAAAAQEAVV